MSFFLQHVLFAKHISKRDKVDMAVTREKEAKTWCEPKREKSWVSINGRAWLWRDDGPGRT